MNFLKTLVKSFAVMALAIVWSGAALAAPVNVNKATAAEIAEALEGVGPVKAESIVAYRESVGTIKSAEELKTIKGIGDKTFESIKADVRLTDAE